MPSEDKKTMKSKKETLVKGSKQGLEVAEQALVDDFERLEIDKSTYIIEKKEFEKQDYLATKHALLDWLNSVCADKDILVKDLTDLSDGYILGVFYQSISGEQIPDCVNPCPLQADHIKNITVILTKIEKSLQNLSKIEHWSTPLINGGYIPAIIHLLVALSGVYNQDIPLPPYLEIEVKIIGPSGNTQKITQVIIDRRSSDFTEQKKNDVIDMLYTESPEKINPLKKAMCTFVNKLLVSFYPEVNDLVDGFKDGLRLLYLTAVLGGYYIPRQLYEAKPLTRKQMSLNVGLALGLLKETGLLFSKDITEGILNGDEKSTLKVLFAVANKYK